MKSTVIFGLLLLLTSCAKTGPSDGCAGWRPIVLDGVSIDGLTEADAATVLAHNRFGRAQGCW